MNIFELYIVCCLFKNVDSTSCIEIISASTTFFDTTLEFICHLHNISDEVLITQIARYATVFVLNRIIFIKIERQKSSFINKLSLFGCI